MFPPCFVYFLTPFPPCIPRRLSIRRHDHFAPVYGALICSGTPSQNLVSFIDRRTMYLLNAPLGRVFLSPPFSYLAKWGNSLPKRWPGNGNLPDFIHTTAPSIGRPIHPTPTRLTPRLGPFNSRYLIPPFVTLTAWHFAAPSPVKAQSLSAWMEDIPCYVSE